MKHVFNLSAVIQDLINYVNQDLIKKPNLDMAIKVKVAQKAVAFPNLLDRVNLPLRLTPALRKPINDLLGDPNCCSLCGAPLDVVKNEAKNIQVCSNHPCLVFFFPK